MDMPLPTLEEEVRDALQAELGLLPRDAEDVVYLMRPLQRFRASAALRLMRRARTPFDVYFCAESFAAATVEGKCAKMTQLFVQRLATNDKIELLASWAFSDQYRFDSSRGPVRHVMHSDCASDTAWLEDNIGRPTCPDDSCSVGLNSGCPCVGWIRDHPAAVDPSLETLVSHLCDMRNSMVHESWPVFMVAELIDVPGLPPADAASMLDCYPSNRNDPEQFRTYETGITLDRFKVIVRMALREEVLTRNL
jgi:hypothetical protein